jgi:DNA-binding beta-propeller fold protein YncE
MHVSRFARACVCLLALVVIAEWTPLRGQQGGQAPSAEPDFITQRKSFGGPYQAERQLVYAAVPSEHTDPGHGGYGGVSVVVLDAKKDWRFVKRIPLWNFPASIGPEYVKGIAANAATGMLYVSTDHRLGAWDLTTEKKVWEQSWNNECCDRMAVSPDGKVLYAPSYGRRDRWYVVDALTGKLIKEILTPQSMPAHNTLFSLDGSMVFLEGSGSPYITVADAKTHEILRLIGPFGGGKAEPGSQRRVSVRPMVVKGDNSYLYGSVSDLIGFEVAEVASGKVLHRVEVPGFASWTRQRIRGHGVPSHGLALTPDEKELWVTDGVNGDDVRGYVHVFDATAMPPTYMRSVVTRKETYWITVGLDGKYIYPSSGDVIDAATKQVVGQMFDEYGKELRSEKLIEVLFVEGKPARVVDQFGTGQVPAARNTSN